MSESEQESNNEVSTVEEIQIKKVKKPLSEKAKKARGINARKAIQMRVAYQKEGKKAMKNLGKDKKKSKKKKKKVESSSEDESESEEEIKPKKKKKSNETNELLTKLLIKFDGLQVGTGQTQPKEPKQPIVKIINNQPKKQPEITRQEFDRTINM
jgi:hypothetical protein